jgi:putative adhesin
MSARSLAALVLFPIALSAQADPDEWLERCRRDDWDSDRVKHCEVRETSMRPTRQALVVDPGQNGGVSIRGWDEDSIAVFAKIQTHAQSEDEAAGLAREVRVVAGGASIRAEGPGRTGRRQSWSVSFEVYVPHRTDLALETENGPVGVRDVTGRLVLAAHNGPVSLAGVGGSVRARVQNGPLHVVLTGARWEGEGLDAETVNGPVDLEIPESYSAQLETRTVNGPMRTEFPLTVTIQGDVSRRITATLGQGGAPVRVVTTNGPLAIRRARQR